MTQKMLAAAAFALSLAIPAAADEAKPAQPQQDAEAVRADVDAFFKRRDKNNDSLVSRDEYNGTAAAFDRYDLDYNGFLSKSEMEQGLVRRRTRDERLQNLDADGDGRIARHEFKGDDTAFARLDRNNDGFIGDDDKSAAKRSGGADAEARFKAMDVNSDGQLTRDEWRGTDRTFAAKDKNSDGVLSLDEVKPAPKPQQ